MALTTCPDCQGPLSDTAPSCPKCGRKRPSFTKNAMAVLLVLAIAMLATKCLVDRM